MGNTYYMLGTILGIVHVFTKKINKYDKLCSEAERIFLYIL